ncbi:POTE ankyrin domain family member G-like [Pecten maximus]|uniref:POTE ankyrin domain family member G-like n=1 Tax=Pecten maximus TaxID=6579 RepID=UPI001458C58F|nr:POTE ankyrin domain family member G-like [Pecten maximus]
MTGNVTLDPWTGDWTDEVVTQRDRQLALWSAVDKGNLTTVRAMIDHGMDVNTSDMHGNLVLHTAVIWQSSEMVKELIDAGADVNRQNDNGQTPLHLAADRGKPYAVLQLLESGTYSDIKTKYSEMTALHLAAKSGHHNIVRLLLDHNSNPNTQDCIGKIPEFYAANIPTKKEFEEWRKKNGEITNSDNKTSSSVHYVFVKEQDLNIPGNYRKPTVERSGYPDSKQNSSPDTQTVSKTHSDRRLTATLNKDTKGHSVQPNTNRKEQPKRDLIGQSVSSNKNILKGSNRDTKGHSVHFGNDSNKRKEAETKKAINAKKTPTSSHNVNWKLEFSKEHQERMATNVFDRLAGKKK